MSFEGFIDWAQLRELVTSAGVIKRTDLDDGKQLSRIYLQVNERRNPSKNGYTHYIKVSVKKDERQEGVNYFVGNLKSYEYETPQEVAVIEEEDGLPF